MNDLRECRTCAHVVYKTRGLALCGWGGEQEMRPPVSLDHFCNMWTERPDPFVPREEDEE